MAKKIKMNRIVYYDFSDINCSSFFLNGLFKNQREYNYRLVVSKRTPEFMLGTASDEEWQKNLFSISLFKADFGGGEFFFCIDTHDSALREKGYNIPLLKRVNFYFKANFNATIIENDSVLRDLAHKIYPTTPFCPLRFPGSWKFIPRLRPNPDTGWSFQNVKTRIKQLLTLQSLDQFRARRLDKKKIDVLFVMTYYANQHPKTNDMRLQIVSALIDNPRISAVAGLICNEGLPEELARLRIKRFNKQAYLEHLASSKLVIYVRGPHDCLSFKLAEYLALGQPIVGQKIVNNTQALNAYPHFGEQFAYEDAESILAQIENLLQHPEKLEVLAKSNAEVFDMQLTPKAAVSKILDKMVDPETMQ
jgi:hypothetical protein